jgi:cytochrome c553
MTMGNLVQLRGERAVARGIAVGAVLLSMAFTDAALARDPVAGKTKAAQCVTCHGALGLSQLPNAPNLAGQPAIYVAEQLKAYRSGKRQNEIMSVLAKPLSDQDIDDLAAWYGSIEVVAREK